MENDDDHGLSLEALAVGSRPTLTWIKLTESDLCIRRVFSRLYPLSKGSDDPTGAKNGAGADDRRSYPHNGTGLRTTEY